MSRTLRRAGAVGAVVIGVLTAVALGSATAGAQAASLSISPSSGPPGTDIGVSGTGCTPTDPEGTVLVTAALTGGDTHDTAQATPDAEGAWSTSLHVLDDATDGSQLTITALCEGGDVAYNSATFTVVSTTTTTTTTTTAPSTTTTAPSTPGPGRSGTPPAGAPASPGPQSGLSVTLMPPAAPVVAEPNFSG